MNFMILLRRISGMDRIYNLSKFVWASDLGLGRDQVVDGVDHAVLSIVGLVVERTSSFIQVGEDALNEILTQAECVPGLVDLSLLQVHSVFLLIDFEPLLLTRQVLVFVQAVEAAISFFFPSTPVASRARKAYEWYL